MRALSYIGPRLKHSFSRWQDDNRDCGRGGRDDTRDHWDRDARHDRFDREDPDHAGRGDCEERDDFFTNDAPYATCGHGTQGAVHSDWEAGCDTTVAAPEEDLPETDVPETDLPDCDLPEEDPFAPVNLPDCDLPDTDAPVLGDTEDEADEFEPKSTPDHAAADPFAPDEDGETIAGLPLIDLPEEASDVAEDQVDWSEVPDEF